MRLTDAGLGCPDWPGCYGFITVPETTEDYLSVEKNFPGEVVDEGKAWREMIHRYIASLLGFLILLLFLKDYVSHRNGQGSLKDLKLSSALLLLVIFQGMLGMWTVTLKVHPLVVTAHLIGGLTTLSLLFFYYRNLDKNTERIISTPRAMLLGCSFSVFKSSLGAGQVQITPHLGVRICRCVMAKHGPLTWTLKRAS